MNKLIIFFTILLSSNFTSNRVEKLIQKEVKSVFNIEAYSIESIHVSEEINANLPVKITESNFVQVRVDKNLKGHYYVGKAFGKVDYFDFLVIFNEDLIVAKVKILVYREEHGGEIGSKRWLKQFIGKPSSKKLKYFEDIVGISGATLSAKALTHEVNRVLKTVSELHSKKII
ncbi:FMN-binding protein [Lutibacter sp. TH_r2]|uniref:FMN-binding protein n=1 Tax=Lutibacter sp. TH_r2 TaxID=3082083 RepID=UPI0029541B6D|nr:FMN-binding protein [Lutibacter sp. TH_r2]MDV7187466.1 FMN-binding protein [Lutibacter sp. TH_r2]